jgi:two-component system nitrate/nitrite response regulator NarL
MASQTRNRTLTAREQEIVRYTAQGLTNAEIARRTKLSSYTVRNHLTNIFSKLGATSRTHAVVLLMQRADPAIWPDLPLDAPRPDEQR